MLVLSRKLNEKIRISDDIVITVVQCGGERVRLGVEAPRHIPVHREEIYQAIQEQGEAPSPQAFDPTWPVMPETKRPEPSVDSR